MSSGTFWGHGGPYETWVDFLRRWSAEEPADPAAVPALTRQDYETETWERLVEHFAAALDKRLQAWADRLVRAMAAADDEFTAGRELAQARAGLHTVRALAGHPGLPADLREQFTGLVDREIGELQAQLEQHLDRMAQNGADPRWTEQRRRTLRDNGLTAVSAQAAAPDTESAQDPWAGSPPDRPRRRIVLD
ncbi:hypothetical protein [Streptomyces sp. NBC_01361]|uniref:hypothetical protein n=1 Tax=Streptomyces sp. NBC_01361 TaxID=2903838 RepID=UPI002E352267|nr:hypothetical protein [Streptomyces sp. NBC_01361]